MKLLIPGLLLLLCLAGPKTATAESLLAVFCYDSTRIDPDRAAFLQRELLDWQRYAQPQTKILSTRATAQAPSSLESYYAQAEAQAADLLLVFRLQLDHRDYLAQASLYDCRTKAVLGSTRTRAWPDASAVAIDFKELTESLWQLSLGDYPPLQSLRLRSDSFGAEYVWIAPGSFTMGALPSDRWAEEQERPAHRVDIRSGFWLGRYEVTQALWLQVTGYNRSSYKATAQNPVDTVSYREIETFLARINAQSPDFRYRLPSEAEWEYACRAGSKSRYSFGHSPLLLNNYGWYDDNSRSRPHPVGTKRPNRWGLFDMHGNVWEVVGDYFAPYHLPGNTAPPASGEQIVKRGGCWGQGAARARSTTRDTMAVRQSPFFADTGLRLVLEPKLAPEQ